MALWFTDGLWDGLMGREMPEGTEGMRESRLGDPWNKLRGRWMGQEGLRWG